MTGFRELHKPSQYHHKAKQLFVGIGAVWLFPLTLLKKENNFCLFFLSQILSFLRIPFSSFIFRFLILL
uniref:Uncharacterized protein n=1 Tax=Meloidogyne enterolobii TaxID=390850 RepID=A0A6V7VC01_MELEN|nr:unnamed protein product [Meloidogyne enterolobii]